MTLTSKIAALQDFASTRAALGGLVRGLPRARPREPQGHAQRVPARLRHDPVLRARGVHRQQEEADPLQLLQGRAARRRGRDLRPRHPADAPRARAQGRRRRATAPRSASSCCTARSARRSRRSRACSRRASSTTRARPTARSTRSTGSTSTDVGAWPAATSDRFPCPMHEEPLRLIPHEWRDERDRRARALERRSTTSSVDGDLDPACRFIFKRADGTRTRATGRKVMQHVRVRAPRALARRTASASARSSRRTRRTRTRPSSPATSTTARSPSTAPTPIRAPSTSTASSTSPTAASSSSSRC